jgi:hypothetical protein
MVTNWSPADEIDTCNGNLIVATNKVIVANKILTEHYMISLIDLSELNSKQIKYKNCWYLILFMAESGEKKKKREPRLQRDGESSFFSQLCMANF